MAPLIPSPSGLRITTTNTITPPIVFLSLIPVLPFYSSLTTIKTYYFVTSPTSKYSTKMLVLVYTGAFASFELVKILFV